ncbi:hypothetical protein BY458DRAFT_532884 [Sporodiniella umbellata]|nr:hypothetical protein BY458DRAFT_532884 [Sporodiniella umbellata]
MRISLSRPLAVESITIATTIGSLNALYCLINERKIHDQAEPESEQAEPKKQKQETDSLLNQCPSCSQKLLRPLTLPCGYTCCTTCYKIDSVCVSCERTHTISLQPNVTIQTMQTALVDAIDQALECAICCTRFTTPTTTPCGHTFCKNCLVRSLDHQNYCPFCRDPLDFCPPPTQILVQYIEQLFAEDDETEDALDLDHDNRVPLLTGSLAFPGVKCVIHIFEPRYRLMLRRIMQSSRRRFGLCLIRRKRVEGEWAFHAYGTMLELVQVQTMPDGRSAVEAVGSHRFRVASFELTDGYHMAEIERVDDLDRETQQMLEQQQILRASASRAKLQRAQPVAQATSGPHPLPAPGMPAQPAMPVRPNIPTRPGMPVRPNIPAQPAMPARPNIPTRPGMPARGSSVRPGMPAGGRPPMGMMMNQRRSWAQQAHPETAQVSRAPWLQMHVRGLSVARPKPKVEGEAVEVHEGKASAEFGAVVKHREEADTEELLDDLGHFIEKLMRYKQKNPTTQWLAGLEDPPPLDRASRDRIKLVWWIANLMPLSEEEKIPLLAHRTLRERVLTVVSWKDKFDEQMAFCLNPKPNIPSSIASTHTTPDMTYFIS